MIEAVSFRSSVIIDGVVETFYRAKSNNIKLESGNVVVESLVEKITIPISNVAFIREVKHG